VYHLILTPVCYKIDNKRIHFIELYEEKIRANPMDTNKRLMIWGGIGAHGARETPVPMPNTAVKPRSGYNTWGSPLGK
jgi:hypothetical protein